MSHRPATLLEDRSTAGQRAATPATIGVGANDNALIRLLVLDQNPGTARLIENALWTWPHRIALARSPDEAVTMCQHIEPAALVVSLDFPADKHGSIIRTLRDELPKAVIIALGSTTDASTPGAILDRGASAVVTREELQRSTLHDLLVRLRPPPDDTATQILLAGTPMGMPWRDSEIIGALICDIKGTVTAANECLARWLDYPTASALTGKCVWRDLLNCHADWTPWKTVAGDMTAILQHSVAVKSSSEQLLWMQVEVFAAPNSPTDIQAIFIDQSELAHLTGRSERS